MTHPTVSKLWAILRMWLRWKGRHTNLDCWQSSALAEPSVCALTEDTQTKDWPGTSFPQPPFSPSSCLVHLYLQQNKEIFRERSKNWVQFHSKQQFHRHSDTVFLHLLYLHAKKQMTSMRFEIGDKERKHSLKPAKCRRHSSSPPSQAPSVGCYWTQTCVSCNGADAGWKHTHVHVCMCVYSSIVAQSKWRDL